MADKSEKLKPSEVPPAEDKGKRACKKQTPSTSTSVGSNKKTDDGVNETILAFMKNVQTSLKKNDERMSSICSRLDGVDKALSYDYECDEEYYDESQYCDEEPPQVDVGEKRKVMDNSRFSNMTKKFKTVELCSDSVDETLAENTNELFRNGIDQTRYEELIKDEQNARPENCESLVTVKTNHLIWDVLSSSAKTNDRKLQNIETTVIKGATILVKAINSMAILEKEHNKYGELIENCNESLALLGHANKQIVLARRDLLKPEIKEDYMHLCSHSTPFTSELFGDDISKAAREIEDVAKMSSKITKFSRGTRGVQPSRGRFRSRGRGYRGGYSSRGRPDTSYHSPLQGPSNYHDSKNFQKRGQFRQNKN